MFGAWNNIAKSAEAAVSRWAVKRVFKFLLKKKFGQFIMGEIDLDQLDVQLSQGTAQLSDLALNVDYINEKFGGATSLTMKEGSIRSLSVKMPWNGEGFKVEVDELEVVLAPCSENYGSSVDQSKNVNKNSTSCLNYEMGNGGRDSLGTDETLPGDIHEGVKAIARMVKWFLTSFHVKIRSLIVAFDPDLELLGKKIGPHRMLVMRIAEVECGTCVSEGDESRKEPKNQSFLEMAKLTNFVKFNGAIIELLHLGDGDTELHTLSASGFTSDERPVGDYHPSYGSLPILTGNVGGFSGSVRLSIPWKNGSLDICRLDADIYIEPLVLRVQPSIIAWLLLSWQAFQSLGNVRKYQIHEKSTTIAHLNSDSQVYSLGASKVTPIGGNPAFKSPYIDRQEPTAGSLFPDSHIITDWVPSIGGPQTDYHEEVDLATSVDVFFECFDGIRNSQSVIGGSGMWNWTCSVFSAITAASSLACGSFHVPSEQQHVQTNLRASFSGISFVFSLHDEDQSVRADQENDQSNVGPSIHYLGAKCVDIVLSMQVSPQEMSLEVTGKQVEVADYRCVNESCSKIRNYMSCQAKMTNLQAEVLHALPPLFERSRYEQTNESVSTDFLLRNHDNLVKMMLFETSGVTRCKSIFKHALAGRFSGSTLFSLDLPPIVLWLNFGLITRLMDLWNGTVIGLNINRLSSDVSKRKHEAQGYLEESTGASFRTLASKKTLKLNISMPNARLILCFPFNDGNDELPYHFWDQFIAFDISSTSGSECGHSRETSRLSVENSQKWFSSMAVCSLHLGLGNLAIYLLESACEDDMRVKLSCKNGGKFQCRNLLSACNTTESTSVISMLWQDGAITGPWIVERAKSVAMSEDGRSRCKTTGKSCDFATVTTVKNREINTHTHQEIVLSSSFFMHVHLFNVAVVLDTSRYKQLLSLLNQFNAWLQSVSLEASSGSGDYSVSQTSMLLECDSVEMSMRPDMVENVKASLQSELPGFWSHIKLKLQKFNLLSVSNIGAIKGNSFLWVALSEGTLWGSVSTEPDHEFLLISCSNSVMKRGDGGSSNVLSLGSAGADIVHLWQPEISHGFTNISIRCGTVAAVGGRLDWVDVISSFFVLPSEKSVKNDMGGSSLALNLVDVALSYEPYFNQLFCPTNVLGSSQSKEVDKSSVACLLAASSVCLLTTSSSMENEYRIRAQDVGLLLCASSNYKKLQGSYSVQNLREFGYVKVAREAFIEATLKLNCSNGLLWELECANSQIYVETCHDSTAALICLAAQLQKLFAPDVEESIVHLQTRWKDTQWAQNESNLLKSKVPHPDAVPLHCHTYAAGADLCIFRSCSSALSSDTADANGVSGLMDEICENAFPLGVNVNEEASSLCYETAEISSDLNGMHLENSGSSFEQIGYMPEIIESYCLSDLRPLSELSKESKLPSEIQRCRSMPSVDGGLDRGDNGWYGDASFQILENHILELSASEENLEGSQSGDHRTSADSMNATGRVLLRNINVRWRMYEGSDWRDSQSEVEQSMNLNSRDTSVCLELDLSNIDLQYDTFPSGGRSVSKLSVSVEDFHLYDRGRDAPWKLVLGYYSSKGHPRESSSKALKMELEAIRPDPLVPLEEYRLRIALLPMLLHLHQCQLDFLVSYFGKRNTPVDTSSDLQDPSLSALKNNYSDHHVEDEALLPYFQKFDIWPILVRVDYCPHHVDIAALRSGNYAELVNLVPWKGIELLLKHVHAAGVYGWGNVCDIILGQWLEDVSQNQRRKILKGLPTIRSMVAVASGARKLVSEPLESYRKDQKVVKGVQRGTLAFLRSISLEAVGLGVHLAAGAHDILVQAEYMLTSVPPSVSSSVQDKKRTDARFNQPKDAQEGIQQACASLSDGLGKSASALVQSPMKKYNQGASAGSAVATAIRAVPTAAISPASACASAVHYALLGIRNSLDPEHKKESVEKYSGPSQPLNQE